MAVKKKRTAVSHAIQSRPRERTYVGPVCDIICPGAEFLQYPVDHEQNGLCGTMIHALYGIMNTVENLLMIVYPYSLTSRRRWETRIKTLTLNKLALVPNMKPTWSKKVVHAVPLSGSPLVKCVPT